MNHKVRLVCQPYQEGFSLHLTFHDRDLYLNDMINSDKEKHIPDGEPYECTVDKYPYEPEAHEHAIKHGCWYPGNECPFVGKGWLPPRYKANGDS